MKFLLIRILSDQLPNLCRGRCLHNVQVMETNSCRVNVQAQYNANADNNIFEAERKQTGK